MRPYKHYAFREWAASKKRADDATPQHLRTDVQWIDYFGDTPRSHQRAYHRQRRGAAAGSGSASSFR